MSERKDFTPAIRSVDGAGKVTIVLATLNEVDKDGDVTLPGFFGRQDAVIVPTHDWDHVPLGKAVISERGREALADLSFNLSVPAALDWYRSIKFDFENPPALQEYSYGYDVLPGGSAQGQHNGKRVRFLQPLKDGRPGAKVHEVSPVLLGAGMNTRTLAVKHGRVGGLNAATRNVLTDIYLKNLRAIVRRRSDIAERGELKKVFRQVAISYSEDRPETVLSEARSAAKAAIETYAPLLGLSDVKVRWFSGEHDDEFIDFMSPRPLLGRCAPLLERSVIWLHSELSAPDAWSIAAHELRHLAGGDEDEAMVYEIKAADDWRTR